MQRAFINAIGTAVPPYEVHRKFVDYAPRLLSAERNRRAFARMAERAQIERRYSFLEPDPAPDRLDRGAFYARGRFPDTASRMQVFQQHAFALAARALDDLGIAPYRSAVTHLIITSCTGFYAPGLDLEIVERLGLDPGVERTIIGFMGCYAALNALKLARHIVRSEPGARVVVLNLELCTLHLQETDDLETVLSFLIFADGCAASLISAEPRGLELKSFHATVVPDTGDQITWTIGRSGFDMRLSGKVPGTIGTRLPQAMRGVLGGRDVRDIRFWAIHPGGRSVLDAIEQALRLERQELHHSRQVLRDFGNMSSATVMFVLRAIAAVPGTGPGCAMAFGPGLTVESMVFEAV